MLLEDGGVCTIEYTNVASSQTFFRGLSPEANATFSGRDYDIVRKQPNPPPSPATTCQCLCGCGVGVGVGGGAYRCATISF